jgi:hypothetical protein
MPRSVVALMMVLTLGLMACKHKGEWPRLKEIDPSLAVLQDPQRLLALASTYIGPTGKPTEHPSDPTIETRHEALRALLRLQPKRFHVEFPPVKDTTGIDHVVLETLSGSNNMVRLLATPSRIADRKASEGDY